MIKTTAIKWLIIFLILSGFVSSASAFETSQLQWREGVSAKLLRNEEITYMGYSIKAVAFPQPVESERYREIPVEPVEPFVLLNISKDGILINTTALKLEESFVTKDGELKVTVKGLPSSYSKDWLFQSYNPSATVELNPRGMPHIEVLVETDYDEYISSSGMEIIATVILENTGTADAVNVDMNVNTELPVKSGGLKYHYDRVRKGESLTNTITFLSPAITEREYYDIITNVTGYDVKDISYTTEFLNKILIVPEPQQIPYLRKSTSPRIYLKDQSMVTLSFKNNANQELKNVSITDSLPDGFKLVGNHSLQWVVDIPANGDWDYRYLIRPIEANKDGTVLPAAIAEFNMKKEYNVIRSNRPEILVYGPNVVLNKQTDISEVNPGDKVTVIIFVENTGSTPTMVIVDDKLPEGVTMVSGSTRYEEYLEANKAVSFSYTLTIDSKEPVKLPPATAEYFELGTKGGKISAMSQEVEIMIRSPDETPAALIEEPPASESPDNSIDPGEGEVDVPEEIFPEGIVEYEPEIDESIPDMPADAQNEIYGFLNFILGCNDVDTNSSYPENESNICNFFR